MQDLENKTTDRAINSTTAEKPKDIESTKTLSSILQTVFLLRSQETTQAILFIARFPAINLAESEHRVHSADKTVLTFNPNFIIMCLLKVANY